MAKATIKRPVAGSHATNHDEEAGLLATIEHEQESQLKLCEALERIADGLPAMPDTVLVGFLVELLRTCFPRQSILDDEYLFPALRKVSKYDGKTSELLSQLKAERQTDEYLAHDLADNLEQMVPSARIENPNMLGYMLRHFFECRRRQIAWYRGVIMPLARERLKSTMLCCITARDVNRLLEERQSSDANSPADNSG